MDMITCWVVYQVIQAPAPDVDLGRLLRCSVSRVNDHLDAACFGSGHIADICIRRREQQSA